METVAMVFRSWRGDLARDRVFASSRIFFDRASGGCPDRAAAESQGRLRSSEARPAPQLIRLEQSRSIETAQQKGDLDISRRWKRSRWFLGAGGATSRATEFSPAQEFFLIEHPEDARIEQRLRAKGG